MSDRGPYWAKSSEDAAANAGVMTRHAASQVYGRSRVTAQLTAQRWQTPAPGVVVLHNGPLTEAQVLWVALLCAPPGALLHGLSAARCDGLRGLEPDGLTLVIPGSSRPCRDRLGAFAREADVRVRWSTKLGPEDVNSRALPPRTRLGRSLVDAASERISERRARVIVLAAVQQRLLRPASLWDALSRRGRCRNRRIIAESIVDATGGIESLPESDFAAICRHRRLPAPRRQQVLCSPDGRYYLDNDWPEFGVRAEVHGIPHSEVSNWDHDLLRQNAISIEGGGLLLFSSYATRHLPDQVGDQLERMLRRHGWSG